MYDTSPCSRICARRSRRRLDNRCEFGGARQQIEITTPGVDTATAFLIANFGLGVQQDLDPVTGAVAVVLGGQLDGRPLRRLNFVLVDSVGALWCSVSAIADDLVDTIARGAADGFIFRVATDRRSELVVADAGELPELHGAR